MEGNVRCMSKLLGLNFAREWDQVYCSVFYPQQHGVIRLINIGGKDLVQFRKQAWKELGGGGSN